MVPKSSRLALAVFCVAPLALFAAFFHWQILDPTNVGWLIGSDGDWGQNALGWHAFQHSGWMWPPARDPLLAWPTGTTLLYTDSNPLLSLPMKLLAGVLPDDFQFTGWWYLGCIVLQTGFAYLLLRRHAPGPWAALPGVLLLTLLPSVYFGIDHATLIAHWTILWALWIFLEAPGPHKNFWYAAMLGVSALIHPYLLLMNAAIWLSDAGRQAVAALRARDGAALKAAALATALVALVPILGSLLAGLSPGPDTGGEGYGFYSMGLDAPVNPFVDENSFFIPGFMPDEGQYGEGFHYLGAGLLFLLLAVGLGLAFSPSLRARAGSLRPMRPLLPALAILLLLAVTNVVQFYGTVLLALPLPQWLLAVLSVFRASGRLFWPIGYVLVLAGLRIAYAAGKPGLAVICCALGLQLADLVPFMASVRAVTAAAAHRQTYPQLSDPRWDGLVGHARLVEFHPDAFADLAHFYQIAWRATARNVPVNTMYLARNNPRQDALEQQMNDAFAAGQVRQDRLYVILNPCALPDSLAGRARSLDGVMLIPPQGTAPLPPAHLPAKQAVGQTISFAQDTAPPCVLGDGWDQEDDGLWSNSDESQIMLHLAAAPAAGLLVSLRAGGDGQAQKIHVEADDVPVADLDLRPGIGDYAFRIPPGGKDITLSFRIAGARPHGAPKGWRDASHDRMRLESVTLRAPVP